MSGSRELRSYCFDSASRSRLNPDGSWIAETCRFSAFSSSRIANRRRSRISLGDRYWPMKLSSLKWRIA
jgi:hypothetical protein